MSAGEELLDCLSKGVNADLLLLDWKMPGISGIEVMHRLRSSQNDIPIIFLTMLNDQVYEEAGLLGGAVDFMEKSRSLAILLRRIFAHGPMRPQSSTVPQAHRCRTS